MKPSCRNLRNDRILVVQLNELSVISRLWITPIASLTHSSHNAIYDALYVYALCMH